MTANDDILRSLDAKLSALLVLVLDGYVRETKVARPKPRSVDVMLADVGLTPQLIGKLLGKTDRAVQKQIQAERKRKSSKRGSDD